MQTVGLTIAYYHCIPHLDNILHLDITLRSRRIWIAKKGLVEEGDDEEKK